MPIGNITQSVSTIPAPPHRGVDVQTVFVNKQEDFQDHLADITIDELNTLKDQLNSRIGEINSTATTMNGYATSASSSASTATTKAEDASTSASEALTSRNQASTFATNSSNSATKASQWANNNYDVEVETGNYSAKHWSTVAQNASINKVDKVTSTDNAIVRFDGTTGKVQNSAITIDDNGNIGSGIQTFNGFGGSGFKNYIINGNFDVWQYKDAGLTYPQTSSGYGSCDRWVHFNVGSTKTTSSVVTNKTEPFNAIFYCRTVVASIVGSGNAVGVQQRIEHVNILQGKTCTLSFYAKADSNKNIAVDFVQYFGTGGTPSEIIEGISATKIQITSSWAKYKLTVSVPSIAGKSAGSDFNDGLWVRFWFDAGSDFNARTANLGQQSGTFDIAQVQLEEGSIATPFENRPYGLELSLCQRYLPPVRGFFSGHAATTNEVVLSVPTKVVPRVAPTGIIYSAGGTVYYTNTWSPITAISFFAGNASGHHTLKVNPTGSPLTIGQGVMVGLPPLFFTGCEL